LGRLQRHELCLRGLLKGRWIRGQFFPSRYKVGYRAEQRVTPDPPRWCVSMPDYRTIYRTNDGHIRVPFASLGMFLRVAAIRVSIAEERAIENVATFVFSVGILSRRLKAYIDAYGSHSWVDVPMLELFLDTQGFFLFVQQFLEDLALIVRMSLPPNQRHQMPQAFSRLTGRLLQGVLESNAPLARFLSTEQSWFAEIKDLRDDILHRTSFDRDRVTTFPDLVGVLRAGGGQPNFIHGATLAGYLGGVLVRVFALACLADDFAASNITAHHPGAWMPLQRGILLSTDEMELCTNDKVFRFGLGTPLYWMEAEKQSALEFFINAGEELGN
jgi:hypothetical protein